MFFFKPVFFLKPFVLSFIYVKKLNDEKDFICNHPEWNKVRLWNYRRIEEYLSGFGWGRTTRQLLWNVWARRGDGLIFLGTGIADSHWIGPATVGHWAKQHRAARAHTAPAVPTVVKSETRGRKGRTTHTALFDVNVRHPVARPCGVLDHSCNIHTYLLYQISPLLHFWRRINSEVQSMSMVQSNSLN